MAAPAHRSVSNIRPSVSNQSTTPGSPHTPVRAISSSYSSPSTLRAEEDCVVIEIGSRYLRAGFAGDAVPKAVIGFGPEEQRRAGDFTRWQAGYNEDWRRRAVGKDYGSTHELWNLDLRGVDLGLIGDKIERALREALTKYLFVDSRPRRMALVLPPEIPLTLLSTTLDSLFHNFQPPTISLMSVPVMATVAAGLRAGLVIDIGWMETVVTGVYEYREVSCHRSVRARKLLGQEMLKMLGNSVQPIPPSEDGITQARDEDACRDIISFEESEEILARMAWCKPAEEQENIEDKKGLAPVKEEDDLETHAENLDVADKLSGIVSIPLTSTKPPTTLRIPFVKLAEPCERALLAGGMRSHEYRNSDDEEMPLHQLVYRTLLLLPVDIRSVCMARIIFTGGGSKLPGLKQRIMDELQFSIDSRGWDPVQGKAVEQLRLNDKLRWNRNKQANLGPTEVTETDLRLQAVSVDDTTIPRHAVHEAGGSRSIEDSIRREAQKGGYPAIHGTLRAVETMGAWSGASLISQLRVPAVSIVEREKWLQNGINGASRPGEVVVSGKQRQSVGVAGLRTGVAESNGWTLGPWG